MSPAVHLVQLLGFVLVASGPLPLSLLLALRPDPSGVRCGWAERLIAVGTYWCFAQALLALLLGLAGCFTPRAIVGAEVAVLVVGGAALVRRGDRGGLLALRPPALAGGERVALLALVVVAVTLLWWSAAVPVVDFDSWAFHMPTMVQWQQTGRLVRFEAFASKARYGYPYTWEALCALLLASFGEDVLVTSPNLIAWLLLGLATYQLGRDFGARRAHALACAALLMVMPGIIVPLNSMHVDVPFAAFFAVSARSLLAWQRTGARQPRRLAVLSAGLLAGIRATALFYVFLGLVVLAVRRLVAPREPAVTRKTLPGGMMEATCSAAALFIAGFWYVKNLVELGNPLATQAIRLGSVTLFPGAESTDDLVGTALAFTFVPWQRSAWVAIATRASGELGLPFLVLVLLAGAGLAAVVARRASMRAGDAAVVWGLLVGTLLAFWITPGSGLSGIQIRLGFPCLAMLAVAAACGATALRLRGEVLAAVVAISATLIITQSKVLAPGLGLLVIWEAWTRMAPRYRRQIEAAVLAAGVAVATFVARDRRERGRRQIYDRSYEFLEQNVDPHASIAYEFTPTSYIFYGRYLQRSVRFALFTGEQPLEWLRDLRASRVDVVILGPAGRPGFVEQARHLLDDAESGFVHVYGTAPADMAIYRRAGD